MYKRIIFVCLICTILLLNACSIKLRNTAGAEDGSQNTEQSTEQSTAVNNTNASNAGAAEAEGQGKEAEPEYPADKSMTLDSIKKAAQEAGYEVKDVQDFQLINEVKPVNGFTLIYKDENSESHIPVLEFKNAGEAGKYADEINIAGYNLCIINGKYLTVTGAQYGVTVNDKETEVLESLLKNKVMKYTEAPSAPLGEAKDFAEAYLQIETIRKALDKLVNRSVLLHDKEVPDAERMSNAFITFSMISSGDLAFTSNLCEDQTKLDAIVEVWQMFGATDVKLKHEAANEYVLTGKRAGQDTTFEIQCSFDPGTGSLHLNDRDGNEVLELFEFVPLGGDRYAFQTLYERAIIEYKDGKILSFVYSLNKRDKALAYDYGKDGIYGKNGPVDEAWVTKAGENSYEQFVTFDGSKIKIRAVSFTGQLIETEIKTQ